MIHFIKKIIFFIMIFHSNLLFAEYLSSTNIVLKSVSSAKETYAALPDYSIVTVSFKFNPYSKDFLQDYLPDGYITVNNEYDMTELVAKTFFYPLIDTTDIKVLVIDLNSMIKIKSFQRAFDIKHLIEKITEYSFNKKKNTYLAIQFDYTNNMKQWINELWSYTSTPILLNGVVIGKGYDQFINDSSKQSFLKKIKYLGLSSNRIGANEQEFKQLVRHLNQMQKLEILDLQNNAIGSIDHSLNDFVSSLTQLDRLQYLNLNNNLIGAHKKDTKEFNDSIQQASHINVSLLYNQMEKN